MVILVPPRSFLLVEFGTVKAADLVEGHLTELFGLLATTVRAETPEVRKKAWQLNAEDLLSEVLRLRAEHSKDFALGLSEDDLYIPQLNFVFGLASHDGRSAVVSTRRLRSDDPSLYKERLLKEVVHEMGHAFGLGHCDDARCVMHFSNSLQETDHKRKELCGQCGSTLRSILQ
jgi:archaemetzincin